jgi:hypothetical protein
MMARKVNDRERVLRFLMEAGSDELRSLMDQLRVILDVRFPSGKPKRGRKAKTGVTIHDGKSAPEIRELREPA